jgi:hypothetical protein
MKEPNHTPGPWKADGGDVWDSDMSICILNSENEYGPGNRNQIRANARLIAAAPDMLEALEEIARLPIAATYPDGPCIDREDMSMVLAAISKAKGKP